MSSSLFMVVPVALLVFTVLRAIWAHNQEAVVFGEVAARTGLRVDRGRLTWLRGTRLTGDHEGIRVEVHPYQRDRNKRSERWTRYVAFGVPKVVSLSRQGLGMDLVQAIAGADHQTGDDGFDRAVLVRGDPLVLTAALDAASRQRFFNLMQRFPAARVKDGQVVVEVSGRPVGPSEVIAHLDEIVALARSLTFTAAGTQERLSRILEGDSFGPVRLRAAEALAQRTRLPVAEAALQHALKDRAPEVRAVAARALGDTAAMLRLLASDTVPNTIRADLCARLSRRGAAPTLLAPILPRLLDAPGEDAAGLRLAALRVVAAVDPELARRVLPPRARSRDPHERAAVAVGLGALGDEAHERAVLALLEDDAIEVRLAAAQALGRVGTLHAVPPLRVLAGAWLGSADVAAAASEAITHIEARHGAAEAGRLALVEDGGHVSLVGEGGEVAVVDPGRGPDPRRV